MRKIRHECYKRYKKLKGILPAFSALSRYLTVLLYLAFLITANQSLAYDIRPYDYTYANSLKYIAQCKARYEPGGYTVSKGVVKQTYWAKLPTSIYDDFINRAEITVTETGVWWSYCSVSFTALACTPPKIHDPTYTTCIYPSQQSNKNNGSTCDGVGNPCNPANGNKYESVTDYRGTGLSFTRSYNSLVPLDGDLGFGWSGNRYKRLEFSSATQITVRHADGKGEPFTKTNGNWVGDPDTDRVLREAAGGFAVDLPDGRTEQYDTAGKLISETDRNGQVTAYAYNLQRRLASVTAPYGHTLQFVYDPSGHLTRLTDPNGKIITYSYDARYNLSTVSYPDGAKRIYHYENTSFPHHLTGITDENGDRYSTFAYDSAGRAIFTGHAQTDNGAPQEGFSLDYNSWGGQ